MEHDANMMYILRLEPFEGEQSYQSLHDEAAVWHRRLDHCDSGALQQLAKSTATKVKYFSALEPHDCPVCLTSKSKKKSHPASDRPRSSRRLELVHVDIWGKHAVETYSECKLSRICRHVSCTSSVIVLRTIRTWLGFVVCESWVSSTVDPPNIPTVRRSRRLQGQEAEGHSKQHWSLRTEGVDDDHPWYKSLEYNYITKVTDMGSSHRDAPSTPGSHRKGNVRTRQRRLAR